MVRVGVFGVFSGTLLASFWRSLGSKWGAFLVILGVWWRPWVPWARSLRRDPLPSFPAAPFLAILAPKGSPRGSQNGAKTDKNNSPKSMQKSMRFLMDLWSVFGWLWGCFWDPEPLKMTVSCKRGAHFQKFVFFMLGLTFC